MWLLVYRNCEISLSSDPLMLLCTAYDNDNDNETILFDHNIQIYITDLQ